MTFNGQHKLSENQEKCLEKLGYFPIPNSKEVQSTYLEELEGPYRLNLDDYKNWIRAFIKEHEYDMVHMDGFHVIDNIGQLWEIRAHFSREFNEHISKEFNMWEVRGTYPSEELPSVDELGYQREDLESFEQQARGGEARALLPEPDFFSVTAALAHIAQKTSHEPYSPDTLNALIGALSDGRLQALCDMYSEMRGLEDGERGVIPESFWRQFNHLSFFEKVANKTHVHFFDCFYYTNILISRSDIDAWLGGDVSSREGKKVCGVRIKKGGRPSSGKDVLSTLDAYRVESPEKLQLPDGRLAEEIAAYNEKVLDKDKGWSEVTVKKHISNWRQNHQN